MSDLNRKPSRNAGMIGTATEATVDKRAAPVNALTHDGSHNNASRRHAAAPTDNIKPLVQERHFEFHCAPDATPVAAVSCDVEQVLRDCIPGGYSADPQRVADSPAPLPHY
ncbi:hypothetical protein [Burkholderia plantarii]|uniref:hypothetical protein n=1 Tax=Burkholderia plantarii TaxID=41899 RepID=UPI000F4F860F|nr:hypothetical protein [Burkholderia plantarii]